MKENRGKETGYVGLRMILMIINGSRNRFQLDVFIFWAPSEVPGDSLGNLFTGIC
jgi:hypothetical protein